MSKVAEMFIYCELMAQVSPSVDPCQYGCLKGSITTICLIRMYHPSVEWLDRGSAIVNLLVYYGKAFHLIRHFIAL